MRHRDDAPFQSLGFMDGEQLDAVGPDLGLPGLQPLLPLRGRPQVVHQCRRGCRTQVGEGPDDLGELVEVAGPDGPAGVAVVPGEHLGTHPGHLLDVGDQVGQRFRRGVPTQVAKFTCQFGQPLHPGGGHAEVGHAPQVGQCLGESDGYPGGLAVDLGEPAAHRRQRVGVTLVWGDHGTEPGQFRIVLVTVGSSVGGVTTGDIGSFGTGRSSPARQLVDPSGQGLQVGRPDVPAHPGEQPEHGDIVAGVDHHPQGGEDVGDFGDVQQSGPGGHLHRHVASHQQVVDRLCFGILTDQHRRGERGTGVPGVVAGRQVIGEPLQFLLPGVEPADLDLATTGAGA